MQCVGQRVRGTMLLGMVTRWPVSSVWFSFCTGVSCQQRVDQNPLFFTAREGQNITIHCTYSEEGSQNLHWFKQDPGKSLTSLFYVNYRGEAEWKVKIHDQQEGPSELPAHHWCPGWRLSHLPLCCGATVIPRHLQAIHIPYSWDTDLYDTLKAYPLLIFLVLI